MSKKIQEMSSTEAQFLASIKDLEPYRGKWIAILDNEVIAKGENLKEVYKESIGKSKGKTPLFNRIPQQGEAESFIL